MNQNTYLIWEVNFGPCGKVNFTLKRLTTVSEKPSYKKWSNDKNNHPTTIFHFQKGWVYTILAFTDPLYWNIERAADRVGLGIINTHGIVQSNSPFWIPPLASNRHVLQRIPCRHGSTSIWVWKGKFWDGKYNLKSTFQSGKLCKKLVSSPD